MKLKIMTFNLRTSVATCDGINCFENRKPHILNVINKHSPDLIGFQEVRDDMLDFIRRSLSDTYETVACGRDANLHGECTAIAYKRDAFVMIKCETFWLSPTPDVPASTYGGDQSKCPRVTTYAVLKANEAQKPFLFANTHFDHEGKNARLEAARQMTDFFAKSPYPIFFTGDFNDEPDSAPIKMLCESLTDLTTNVGRTFHNYGRCKEMPMKIDYVFTSVKDIEYSAELVSDGPFDGIYPSDHYPVLVTAEYN